MKEATSLLEKIPHWELSANSTQFKSDLSVLQEMKKNEWKFDRIHSIKQLQYSLQILTESEGSKFFRCKQLVYGGTKNWYCKLFILKDPES